MKKKINTKELIQLAVICAVIFVGKELMATIPNISPVATLIILTTIVYGWKALLPVTAFSLLEISIYGFGLWTIMYLYVWPLAVVVTMIFRKNKNALFWALISGIYGLCFGAFCSIPYIFIGGFKEAVAFWISGIPYDLLHGSGNAVLTLILFPILLPLMKKIKNGQIEK